MTRLKELIEEKGITQKALAEDLGFPLQTFNNYVRGEREPGIDTIGLLCDYFQVTADYLLCRSSVPYQAVSVEDARLLKVYHSLPPEIRRAVDGLMEPYAAAIEEKKVV